MTVAGIGLRKFGLNHEFRRPAPRAPCQSRVKKVPTWTAGQVPLTRCRYRFTKASPHVDEAVFCSVTGLRRCLAALSGGNLDQYAAMVT